MRKCYLALIFLFQLPAFSQGIFSNPITGTNPSADNPFTNGQAADVNITASGIGRGSGISASSAANRYSAGSWATAATLDANDYFEFTLTPHAGYQIQFTNFIYTAQRSSSGPQSFAFRSSVDGFVADIGSPTATGTTIDLSAAAYQNITTSITFRLYGWAAGSGGGTFSINDFIFNGTVASSGGAPAPLISLTALLNPFTSVTGLASAEQSYTVSGTNLTGDISVNAPAGYEVSTSSGSGFGASLNLVPSGGHLAGTTIFVRQLSATLGNHGGNISHSSAGAATQQLAVNGKVLATEPVSAPAVSFSSIAASSFDIHLTGGSGEKRLVVMKAGAAITGTPVDGSSYAANSVFGAGALLGPDEFVVYEGAGNLVSVTGLTGSTTYHLAVFEFNDGGVSAASNYYAVAATGSQTTLAAPEGLQLTAVNTDFTIDFDNTLNNVNNGAWAGLGFSLSPATGQLNSSSWAVTGWSDGALAFGGTRTTGDYARGFTTAHPSTGGMYAFEPGSPANRALGFQPGTGDWVPGTITLRIQNQAGVPINSLNVAYKVFVFNNADRSSSFNFSWSTDYVNFTPVTSLDHNTVETMDASPVWVQYDKSTTITGLSVLPGQYIYLRWSSNDASGTGSRDELAIDDIVLAANRPVTGPLAVHFSGTRLVETSLGVQVQWVNETEEEVASYVVERSADGNEFVRLKELVPMKNDGGRAAYSFLDQHPLRQGFYRIRAVEQNGQVWFSNVMRIQLDIGGATLLLYPNPVNGRALQLQMKQLPAGSYFLRICNAQGQEVYRAAFHHAGGARNETVVPGHWLPGVYYVDIRGAATLQQQFFKQ